MRARSGVACAALLLARAAMAGELALPAPGSAAWQPLAFPRIERHTRYLAVEEDGHAILRAESECSASGLLHPLTGVELAATPRLAWRWRLEQGLAPGVDERSEAGDDFAARVYVSFAFEPERAGLLERARRGLAASLYGEEMPGSSLNYVWASREPEGAHWANPFAAESRMIVATSGTRAGWVEVQVDLRADYERAFGHAPPAPLFLALMTDSDNRCSRARASYADFRLLGPARAEP